jgi:opacity protein-like surface antigen
MKLLLAAAVALLSTAAAAKDWTQEETLAGMQKLEYTRYAPSGENQLLDFLTVVQLGCLPYERNPVVRTIRAPEHGTVETASGEGYAKFLGDTAKCNDQKVAGTKLSYKSTSGYTGPDTFTVLVMYPNSFAREVTYKMIVR